ncbi:hypothetical protein MAM1_0084d04638 [Mucor ambiguus]|uniref:Transcriptional coactivator p15 (PC4) C-terminal domain-containing protein n=1 Tax=Mucor ambiguus TaxID=91626 RepID=A0A0C9MCT1_9FUNG|nr:hypothetical protein MAM1_0084d04638 [Mucor ambiguus]
MKSKTNTKPKAIAKPMAPTKTKSTIAKTNVTAKTKATTKTKAIVKTKAVIYDSDADADDTIEKEQTSSEAEVPLYNSIESFHISRGKKLSVGCFRNGDAFVDIRESHPRNISKRFRRGRGICLTMAQWRKMLGLIPEIEKSIKQTVPKNNT